MKLMKRLLSVVLCMALLIAAFPVLEEDAQAAAAYYIEVDITNQIVTVFKNGNRTNSGIVRQMICSTGKSGTPSPTGTYTMPKKKRSSERTEWHKVNGAWATWASRIVGSYLFHSVPYKNKYDPAPVAKYVAALGSPASMGCIRLRDADAKWIALNCLAGTKVRIYKSGKRDNELRELLLDGAFIAANESYDAFLGLEGALALGSKGEEVSKLQTRLNQLGYGAGEVNGVFGASTEAAVKAFQAQCGLTQNGKATTHLQEKIHASSAPYAPITSGSSGDHVKELQQALKTLKLYTGKVDGTYTTATANAVKTFQKANGMTVDGKATDSVRKAILAKAKEVKKQFGDAEYEVEVVSSTQNLAKVKVSSSLALREKATTSSKKLASLKNGTVLTVLKKGSAWSQVQYGSTVGYCKNSYLSFYTKDVTTLNYGVVENPEPTPVPTATPVPTPTPTVDPNATATPEPTATATPKPVAVKETLVYGSVSDAVKNMQQALAELKLFAGSVSGTFGPVTEEAVKTFQRLNGLTADGKATTAVQQKILNMAEQVKAQFGDSDYEAKITETTVTKAKVKISARYLNLRKSATSNSKSLAKLKNNTVVDVIKKGSSWSQVSYNGVVGYCKNSYLKFSSTTTSTLDYVAAPSPTPVPTPTAVPTPTPTLDPNATPSPTPKPVASDETLRYGSVSDAVKNMQQALAELKLFAGSVSGTFGPVTEEAVKTFQRLNGLTADGKATPAVQQKILNMAEQVKAQFGDSDYEAKITETTVTKAKVKISARYLNLRKSATSNSKSLAKLKNNTVVDVIKKGSSWSQVSCNGVVGYCKNSYLKFSSTTTSTLSYEAIAASKLAQEPMPIAEIDEIVETPAPTEVPAPTETPAPAETPAPTEVPAPTATAEPTATPAPTATAEPETLYAVVKDGETALYKAAEAVEANLIDLADAGAYFVVVESDDDWTCVEYADGKAYVETDDVKLTTVEPKIVEATEVPVEATEAPVEVAETPVEVAETPVEATEAPVEATETPVEPASEPVVEPAEVPAAEPASELVVEPTEAPATEPVSEPVIEPTEAPVEEPSAEPAAEPTEAPAEELAEAA